MSNANEITFTSNLTFEERQEKLEFFKNNEEQFLRTLLESVNILVVQGDYKDYALIGEKSQFLCSEVFIGSVRNNRNNIIAGREPFFTSVQEFAEFYGSAEVRYVHSELDLETASVTLALVHKNVDDNGTNRCTTFISRPMLASNITTNKAVLDSVLAKSRTELL